MTRVWPASLTRGAVLASGLVGCVVLVLGAIETVAWAFGGRAGMWSWLAGAALLAAVVPLVRPVLERLADRAAFGRGGDPYAVISGFVHRISETLAVDDVLPQLARSAVQATRSSSGSVRLLLADGEEQREVWPPERPAPGISDVDVALEHAGELVGSIEVAGADETLRETDRELLRRLAAPAGVALSNVRLTHELRHRLAQTIALGEQIELSRERLLGSGRAQQESFSAAVDRQVLRRLDAADRCLVELGDAGGPEPAAALEMAEGDLRACLESLRELAAGLFPPTLEERGVAAALDLRFDQLAAPVVVSDLTPPGARYAPAVEAAVYFCCVAVTDEITTRDAATAAIELSADHRRVAFDIRSTVALSTNLVESVRDRIEALGGIVTFDGSASGSDVRGELLLTPEEEALS